MNDIEDLIKNSETKFLVSDDFEEKVFKKIKLKKKRKLIFKAVLSSLFIIAFGIILFFNQRKGIEKSSNMNIAKREIIPITDKVVLGYQRGNISYAINVESNKKSRRPL